jgi:hypothetical protein
MPLPTDRVHLNEAFLVSAAGGAGLTAGEVRSRRFVAPTRGARVPAAARDPELARASAVLLAARSGAVLCDVSAAHLWNLPLPPWIGLHVPERAVATAVPRGAGRLQRDGVRGRRLMLPADHVTTHRGATVTTPARTWLDCAEFIPIEDLVAMGDALLRRRLATDEDLRAVVGWATRHRGIRNARRARPLLDPGAESPGESLVRAHLLLAGLPRPNCNFNVLDDGQWLARADLAWPAFRLIVEYDGRAHLDEQRRRSDAARRNLLQEAGWRVIVLTAADLVRPWLMVAAIESALNNPWSAQTAR